MDKATLAKTLPGYVPLSMAGSCRNGWQRDGGAREHAVTGGQWGKALCGARTRSFWSSYEGNAVTCPRCLAKLEKLQPGSRESEAASAVPLPAAS